MSFKVLSLAQTHCYLTGEMSSTALLTALKARFLDKKISF